MLACALSWVGCSQGNGDAADGADTSGESGSGSSASSASANPGSGSPPTTDGMSGGAGEADSESDSGRDSDSDSDSGNGSADSAGVGGEIRCRAKGDGKSTVTFINGCDEPLSFRGSLIDGGELGPGEHMCRDVGDTETSIPAIRYWGFIGPDPGGEKHTLAELTLNTDFNDFDWYNISHVDAHNLPMQIIPFGMDECRTLTCADSLLEDCPAEGQFSLEGQLVSCFSPDRDDPDSPVAQYFEAGCADAYSWSGDDQESVVACAAEDFDVVFCP